MSLPTYSVESVEGESHQQTFVVNCCVEGVSEKVTGKGTSRRRAEQEAAELMLGIVKNEFK
jgi:ribonuclease-3